MYLSYTNSQCHAQRENYKYSLKIEEIKYGRYYITFIWKF